MNKKKSLRKKNKKKYRQQTVDYKVGIKPNGGRLWQHYNPEKHKEKKKPRRQLWVPVGSTLTHAAAEQWGKDQREGGSPPSSHPQPCRLLSVRPLICCRSIKPTPDSCCYSTKARLQLSCWIRVTIFFWNLNVIWKRNNIIKARGHNNKLILLPHLC